MIILERYSVVVNTEYALNPEVFETDLLAQFTRQRLVITLAANHSSARQVPIVQVGMKDQGNAIITIKHQPTDAQRSKPPRFAIVAD